MQLPENLVREPYCYLTTTGRTSGEPREIEIWFAVHGETLYLMAGGRERSHWIRNLAKTPAATVRVGGDTFAVTARRANNGEEDALVRRLLLEKYAPGSTNDLTNWGRTALPVALDIQGRA
jgi:deazaflavin-dependent oxidoreductase (nitroreductase family)